MYYYSPNEPQQPYPQGSGYPPQYPGYPPQQQQPQYPDYQDYSQYPQYPQNDNQWYSPMPQTEWPPVDAQYGGGDEGGGDDLPPKKKRRKSFGWQLFKFLLILAVFAGASAWVYITKVQSEVRPYLNVFLDNISVDGIDLSGKTFEEASAAVWGQANAKKSSWYVRLKNNAGEYKDITSDTLGINFDPTEALAQAWQIGHDTSKRQTIFELRDEIEYRKTTSAEFFSIEQSADTSPIDTILQTLEQAAYVEPVSAKVIGFDPNDLLNPFTFESERSGQMLDTTAVKEQILHMVQTFQSGELLLTPQHIFPEVTVDSLKQTVALRYRAVTPIDKHSTEERNNNIRVAFERINGLAIADGSRFSFNKIVGQRSQKNGFYPAYEYNRGELVTGWGGGVCQASTTVYLAAIQSGMEIVERVPHSTPVSYTDLGKDATVSDTKGRELDLVFKNTSGATIYMMAHVIPDPGSKKNLLCEVRIYGTAIDNVKYELEAVTVETLPIPLEPEYIQDKEATYATYTDEEVVVIKASEGSVVETYLNTIVDGAVVNREPVSKDTYPNRRERIYVGVTPRLFIE